MLTKDYLKSILDYNHISGDFTWKGDKKRNRKNSIAGYISHGYRRIQIDSKTYTCHQIAWFLIYGQWLSLIDHIDRNRSNNAIKNLRPATISQNNINTQQRSYNKSGFKGVCYCKKSGKYNAYITKDKIDYNLGYFSDIIEAFLVRQAAEIELFGEFTFFPC